MRLTLCRFYRALLIVVMIAGNSEANAQEIELKSDARQIELLELFTSEGCSSCPPADRWFRALVGSSALWSRVVPIAFHVDYWDYIGWKDRFAQPQFSQRQRAYAKEFNESTVYTPGVRRAGVEWQAWRRDQALESFTDKERRTTGKLSVVLKIDGRISADYQSRYQNDGRSHLLNIAVLGMGLASEIKRGENRGKNLTHDFVVLSLASVASEQGVGSFNWTTNVPKPITRAPRYAVAFWVTREGSQRPVQSVGTDIPEDHALHNMISEAG